MADFYGQNDVPDVPDTKPIAPTPVGQIQPPTAGASDVEITETPRPADLSMTAAPEMPDIPNPAQPQAEARPPVETPPPSVVPDFQIRTVEPAHEAPNHLVLHQAEVVPDANLEKAEAQLPPAEVPLTTDRAVIDPIHAIEKEMKKSVVAGDGDNAAKKYQDIVSAIGVPEVAAAEEALRKAA